MVTIRTVENIKLGSKITFVNGIYAIFIGIFYISAFKFILRINFNAFDSLWGFFERYNPEISLLFIREFILVGIIIIAAGLCITYLSSCILKSKEKELWVVLFIIGIIFWSGLFIIEVINQNFYTIALSFIGWASFIIGMIIPIRYYTSKNYDEY